MWDLFGALIFATLSVTLGQDNTFCRPAVGNDSVFDCEGNLYTGHNIKNLVMCRVLDTKERLGAGELLKKNLSNLDYLHLSGCSLKEIEKGAFEGGNKITQLYLNINSIRRLNLDIFTDLPSLEDLFLDLNPLILERDAVFPKSLSNLKTLWLYACHLSSLPTNLFGNLEHLEYLNLGGNQIRTLEWMTSLKSVKELILALDINEIDPNIFSNLRDLQEFELKCYEGHQSFKKHSVFPELLNLKKLQLKKCNLSSIGPNFFGNLRYLERLYLSDNQIATLDWIQPLGSLQTLLFGTNNVKELDPNIFADDSYRVKNLENLQRIELQGNQLTSLKGSGLRYLKNLKFINLDEKPWQCDDCILSFSVLHFLNKNQNVQIRFSEPPCSSCYIGTTTTGSQSNRVIYDEEDYDYYSPSIETLDPSTTTQTPETTTSVSDTDKCKNANIFMRVFGFC